MTYNPNYSKHNEENRKEKYKRVGIDFNKEYYNDVLKPAADHAGMPVGTFIKRAIDEYIGNQNG